MNEQEELTPLNALEWCKNALRLSDFFVSGQQFLDAVYCLTASDIMFKRVPQPRPDGATAVGPLVVVVACHVLRLTAATSVVHRRMSTCTCAKGRGADIESSALAVSPRLPPSSSCLSPLPSLSLARLLPILWHVSNLWCGVAEDPENYRRCSAESSAHWGKLYLSMLRVAYEAQRATSVGDVPPLAPQPPPRRTAAEVHELRRQAAERRRTRRAGAAAAAGGACVTVPLYPLSALV